MTDLNDAAWENRYREGNTPWDLSGPTPEFLRLAEAGIIPKRGAALVPGGGRGHDAIWLAQRGMEVDLVDFAPSALRAALENASAVKAALFAYRQDFFALPTLAYHQNRYDLFLEYTFFCAIDPERRPDYVLAAKKLLKPGGKLVGLFFPLEMEKEGPPFVVSREEVERLFGPHFSLEFREPAASVKPRAGREFVGIFTA